MSNSANANNNVLLEGGRDDLRQENYDAPLEENGNAQPPENGDRLEENCHDDENQNTKISPAVSWHEPD